MKRSSHHSARSAPPASTITGAPPPPAPAPPAPPQPAPPAPPGTLPAALTFFLTAQERRDVLARLRTLDRDRTAALLAALKLTRKGERP